LSRIPIVRIGNKLIATVQEDLGDQDALEMQETLTERLEKTGASGVLLDLSAASIVDSFLGRLLHDVAMATKLLGAETVVVGIQPAVAVTLVELGLKLEDIHTALDADRGLKLLDYLIAAEERRFGARG
jgi:rsbT antagonist protein RsbS